jgi:bacillithiol system protein YtxJ
MHWTHLTSEHQLNEIMALSYDKPKVIFKHSTRCSISSTALRRVEQSIVIPDVDFYFLDLIAFRSLSNKIAEIFGVHHESPQILLIKSGECTYDESHLSITIDDLKEQLNSN